MSRPGMRLDARQRIAALPASDQQILGGGTMTSAGFIPHFRFRGIRCPVMLEVVTLPKAGRTLYTNYRKRPYPVRTRTGFRYALPGGYSVEGPRR